MAVVAAQTARGCGLLILTRGTMDVDDLNTSMMRIVHTSLNNHIPSPQTCVRCPWFVTNGGTYDLYVGPQNTVCCSSSRSTKDPRNPTNTLFEISELRINVRRFVRSVAKHTLRSLVAGFVLPRVSP